MRKFFVFTVLLYFFLAFPSLVNGYLPECGDGDDLCQVGAVCPPGKCTGSSANVCCTTSGGCNLNGEPSHINQWDYAYNRHYRK